MRKKQSAINGFGLIEVIVAVTIISLTVLALIATVRLAFRTVSDSSIQIQAGFLAEEAIEVIKILRNESWATNISPKTVGTLYYPVFSTVTRAWTLTSTDPGPIDNVFSRTIVFGDTYRNTNQDITDSTTPGAVIDLETKFVTARISWESGSLKIDTYITNLFDN